MRDGAEGSGGKSDPVGAGTGPTGRILIGSREGSVLTAVATGGFVCVLGMREAHHLSGGQNPLWT